jgi:hypothetical protein
MQLKINNQLQIFSPVHQFRERWDLPENFNISLFEAKEWQGLGSLEGAGPTLAIVRQRITAAIPDRLDPSNLTIMAEELTRLFRDELESANAQIGLRPAEVDYAVSGFYDVLQAAAYRLIELIYGQRSDLTQVNDQFDFTAVYQSWLDDSVRISTTTHIYDHADIHLRVRVIYYISGHLGLAVELDGETHYLVDTRLVCPAAGFMYDLCAEVSQAMCHALTY